MLRRASLISVSRRSAVGVSRAIISPIVLLPVTEEQRRSFGSAAALAVSTNANHFSSKLAEARRFQVTSEMWKCSECGKTFRLKNAMTHHINARHAGQAKALPVDASGNAIGGGGDAAPAPPSGTAASFGVPPQETTAAQSASDSAAYSGSGGAATFNQTTAPPRAQQPTPPPPANDLVCSQCSKSFRIASALIHHYQVKHGMTPAAAQAAVSGGGASSSASQQLPSASQQSQQPLSQQQSASSPPPPASQQTTTPQPSAVPQQPAGQQAHASTTPPQQQQQPMPAASSANAATSSPLSSSRQPQAPMGGGGAAVGSGGGQQSDNAAHQTAQSYVHPTETVPQQPPQYHLDIAPSAPEENEIAAHHRCVNYMTLIGSVAGEPQEGFVFEDKCTQFVLATDFEDASPGDPDKDFHTVRVFGDEFAAWAKELIANNAAGNARVMVSGRLRMIPQYESSSNKYYHFPVVQVHPGSGSIHLL